MKNPDDALAAIADAAAVLTYAVGALDPRTATIGDLTPELDRLSRAVARAQVVATVGPQAPLDRAVDGCFAPEDATEHADDLARLAAIAALPSGPVTAVFSVRRIDDGSVEDALRQGLDGQSVVARPVDGRFVIDGNGLASFLAERYLPIDA